LADVERSLAEGGDMKKLLLLLLCVILLMGLALQSAQVIAEPTVLETSLTPEVDQSPITASTVTLDVPYIHQVYDTPDEFVGSWACAPTSAVMILAYHGIVDPDPITVSSPSPHTSDYGAYVSREYTYGENTYSNLHTETTGCGTASGRGAWGYI
jgi:hypothetical protein